PLGRCGLYGTAVWRMVARDRADAAAAQGVDESGPVVRRPERRVHLQVRVEGAHSLVPETEVMRRDLPGRGDPASLRGCERLDRLPRREVEEMQRLAF